MIGSMIHEDRRRKISSMDVSIWWLDVYGTVWGNIGRQL
jgi:hypothetical protein